MESDSLQVYYVNKYGVSAEDPMVSVSVMLLYALAKTGVSTTLIASGNSSGPCDGHLLKDQFGLDLISNFGIQQCKRVFFKKLRLTPLFYLRGCAHILRHRRPGSKIFVISRNTTFLPWLVAMKLLFGCKVLFESHAYHGTRTVPGMPGIGKRKLFGMSNQFRWIERIFLNRCNALLCQASLQRDLYVSDFVRIPTAVIPLGSRECSNTSGSALEINRPMRKVIAYVGNSFPYVDHDILFKALSQCKDLGLSLVWIGLQDSEKSRITDSANTYGVAGACDFKGWMAHPSMMEILQNEAGAGIVLYKPCLHTAAMVSPTKIFDYFAAGLPVIGPSMPSVTDHVRDGEDGAIYDPGDAASLAEGLRKVFSDERNYRRLSAHALTAAQKCTWENRAAMLRTFIETVA
jgi:glycosyltransferase involved in cell wall biosynthesis